MNVFIDIDIDIDIFKSDLIDIDIDIDIFKKCRYIDNRYGLSIYRTPLDCWGTAHMAKVSSTSHHGNRSWAEWWRTIGEKDLLLTCLWDGRTAKWRVRWDAEAWQHIEGWGKVRMAPKRHG